MLKIKKVFCMLIISFTFTSAIFAAMERPGQMKASENYLIILVHGIGGEATNFGDNTDSLRGYLWGKLELGGNVFAYDFSDNLQSCEDNGQELGDRNYGNPAAGMNGLCWIEKAKRDYARNKNYPSYDAIPLNERPQKIILIAHSLGGVGCRSYLTASYYQDDVKKLITIDSPHLGADGFTYYKRWKFDRGLTGTVSGVLADQAVAWALNQIFFAPFPPRPEDLYVSSAYMTSAFTADLVHEQLEKYTGVDLNKDLIKGEAGGLLFWLYLLQGWDKNDHGAGLYEMDPDGDFIREMKNESMAEGMAPIDFRLISARGAPTPMKEYINQYYGTSPYMIGQMMPYNNEYNTLPTEGQKVFSALLAVMVPGSMPFNEGSTIIPYYSSQGHGVVLFEQNNTKRYSHLFRIDTLDQAAALANEEKDALTLASLVLGAEAVKPLMILPALELSFLETSLTLGMLAKTFPEVSSVLACHGTIIDTVWNSGTPNIIDQALFDTPMATVTHLDTDVSIDAYNMTKRLSTCLGSFSP